MCVPLNSSILIEYSTSREYLHPEVTSSSHLTNYSLSNGRNCLELGVAVTAKYMFSSPEQLWSQRELIAAGVRPSSVHQPSHCLNNNEPGLIFIYFTVFYVFNRG